MSELSCVATVSHPREARLGTVGKLSFRAAVH